MTIQPEIRPSAVRRCVAELEAYAPPADPATLAERLGRSVESIIKLDANENPFGPSPLVLERLSQYSTYHVYPDAAQREGRTALAEYAGVPAEHLMLGNGADELIDLLMRAYLEPGDEVLDFPPSFGMYAFNAQLCDARVVEVPRDEQFGIDVDAALAAITPRTKLILLTSPNNPTGTVMPTADVRRLLEAGPLVVLDEAYAEFAQVDGQGYESLIREVLTYPNLVILRTFSKWAGLAGLRAGYGVMPRPLAELLMVIKPPYNVNVAAEAAILASLGERELLMERVRAIRAERERLTALLARVAFLRPWPSVANFVLCDVRRGDARTLRDGLRRRGIFIRYFDKPGLRDRVRISVGRPEHTDMLLAALREMGDEPRA